MHRDTRDIHHDTEKLLQKAGSHIEPSSDFLLRTKSTLMNKIENTPQHRSVFSHTLWFRALSLGSVLAVMAFVATPFLVSPTIYEVHAQEIGMITESNGEVILTRNMQPIVVEGPTPVLIGDVISVRDNAKATVEFFDQGKTDLSSGTTISIQDVKSILVEGDARKEVHIALEQGGLESFPNPTQSGTALHIDTRKGIVKAPADASFRINSDASLISVSVHTDHVEVISEAAGTPTVQQVAMGDTMTITEEPVLIAAQKFPALLATQLIEVQQVTARMLPEVPVQATSGAVLEEAAPADPVVDLAVLAAAQEKARIERQTRAMNGMLEIAEIKLRSSLRFFERNDAASAYASAEGYVATIARMSGYLGLETTAKMQSRGDRNASRVLSKSLLLQMLSRIDAMQLDDQSAHQVKTRMERLFTTESSILVYMSLDAPVRQSAETISDVEDIEKSVRTRVLTGVDAILAIENPDERRSQFVHYLRSIPNDERATRMLNQIFQKAPAELQGYVQMKLHAIKHPAPSAE